MKIKLASEYEVTRLIEKCPHTKNVICLGDNAYTLFATDENENIIAFLSAFYREIPAPLSGQTECFINIVEVIDPPLHRQGIGTALVQEAIKMAGSKGVMQVRAYCDINNAASHMLWLKNGFGISPVKMPDGSIPGSFVTYRIIS